jgi:predicted nucleotidyltransferase
MVRRIAAQFRPDKIILFGSHARGDARPDSDVDLLIVMPVQGSRRQKAKEIDMALADRTVSLDLLVVTPEDFERGRAEIGSVLRPAALEGQVLYDRVA